MPRSDRSSRGGGAPADGGHPDRGTLFVVATPIGNLEDITLRALRVLREVAVVAAEDTRRTANLLRHYEIRTPLISLHEHNERQRTPSLLSRLESGDSVALVTDAGTPGISDPGVHLVAAARDRGIRVEPIPGASSIAAALSAAGQPLERFAFLGFPPIRSKDRKHFWSRVGELPDFLVVVFEAPHRLLQTLSDIHMYLVKRPIVIARELTKAHEEIVAGTAAELSGQFSKPKGEITILICPEPTGLPGNEVGDPQISDHEIFMVFGQITENDLLSRRDAIRAVAQRVGMAPKEVYKALERAKNIGHST